jgi:GGDEF domain-containing protein
MSSQALVVVLAVASTFIAGIAAASLWSAIRHVRRAERERRRAEDVQEAVALIGDALVATHDAKALLVVVLEATVTATGVAGGTASIGGAVVASTGDVTGGRALELPLADDPPAALALYTGDGTLTDEMQHLAGSLAAQGRVALENVRLHRAAREQALTDELTGLPNRRRFVTALSAELSRASRSNGRVSVVLCDLDDFKHVNDAHGHVAGDVVLKHVADVIRSCLREIDVPARRRRGVRDRPARRRRGRRDDRRRADPVATRGVGHSDRRRRRARHRELRCRLVPAVRSERRAARGCGPGVVRSEAAG